MILPFLQYISRYTCL